MGVVVRDIEPVYLRTREDEEIRQGNGDAGCPPAIGELNRSSPDLRSDLVIGQQGLIAAERLALGITGDAAPQLEPHDGTP
jgi:hypothetical protein